MRDASRRPAAGGRATPAPAPSARTLDRIETLPAAETMPTGAASAAWPAGAGPPLYGRTSTSALALTPRAPVEARRSRPGAAIDWNRSRPPVIEGDVAGREAAGARRVDRAAERDRGARDDQRAAVRVTRRCRPGARSAGAICTAPRERIVSDRPFAQPAGSPASSGFTGSGTQQLCSCARGPMYSESTFRTVLPVSRSVELM